MRLIFLALLVILLFFKQSTGRVHCDGSMSCKDGQTCCKLSSGAWGCCPYSNAECCPDHRHCCPGDKKCATTLGISRCVDKLTGEILNEEEEEYEIQPAIETFTE